MVVLSDTTKMMLFLFLGLVIAIVVLGFHRSPRGTFSAARAESPSPSRSVTSPSPSKLYPSDKRAY